MDKYKNIFSVMTNTSDWIFGFSKNIGKEIKTYAAKQFWSIFSVYFVVGALVAIGVAYTGVQVESGMTVFLGIAFGLWIVSYGLDKARKQVMLIYGFGELISQVMEINRRLDKVKETEEVPAKEVNAKAPAQVTKNETKNDTVPGNSASSDPFGSWSCPKCGTKNLNSRKSCWRCEYEL